jgi:hypothetical protein
MFGSRGFLYNILLKDPALSFICNVLTLPGCGGNLKKPFGRFTSPGYPRGYPINTDCEWTITVDWGHSVELTVEDFSFENGPDCYRDSVTVSLLN